MTTKRVTRTTRPDNGPTVAIETITPAQAKQMLQGNIVNRKLRKGRVDLYAKYMTNDQWRITGESIVFAADGQLLQGQHRLSACIQAEVPFQTVVVRGAEEAAMRVMDTGMARSAADMFTLEGVGNATAMAAMVRQVLAVHAGIQSDTGRMQLITRDEMLEFVTANNDALERAWTLSRDAGSSMRHSRAAWGTLAFLLCEADTDLAIEYFNGIGTGVGLSQNDARLALRRWFGNAAAARRSVTWAEQVALGIRAWNNWVTATEVTHIKAWKPVQDWPEIES